MHRLALAPAAALTPAAPGLPPATPGKGCAAAGSFWPTMTLALDGSSAWIACKEQSRVVRVNASTGKTLRSVRLGAQAIAVTKGLGATWAVDSSSTLYRITAKKVQRSNIGA